MDDRLRASSSRNKRSDAGKRYPRKGSNSIRAMLLLLLRRHLLCCNKLMKVRRFITSTKEWPVIHNIYRALRYCMERCLQHDQGSAHHIPARCTVTGTRLVEGFPYSFSEAVQARTSECSINQRRRTCFYLALRGDS